LAILLPRPRSSSRLEEAKLKRKTRDFENRKDFCRIKQLKTETVQKLDKIRYDLQESIEKTSRIQQAFLKQLNKESLNSNRIKHIVQQLELFTFYSESQRKILDTSISDILRSKQVRQFLKIQEEEEEEERTRQVAALFEC
jgi:hypothetical protein